MEDKKKLAVDLFRESYNCSQSVLVAFHEECGLSREVAERLSAPFGGGVGRQREVCGAVSGMTMVLGLMSPFDGEDKALSRKEIYATTQELCGKFKERHGSIVCKEILKSGATTHPTPDARTSEYYATRPCEKCVEDAAAIIAEYLKNR